jgi:hypothetical protein
MNSYRPFAANDSTAVMVLRIRIHGNLCGIQPNRAIQTRKQWEYQELSQAPLLATTALLASSSIGAQIARSPELGVIRLSTRLTATNTTTTHTSQRETRDHPAKISSARDITITAIPTISAAWISAAIRSAGGNCPGNAPPIAYAPQGAPAAKAT